MSTVLKLTALTDDACLYQALYVGDKKVMEDNTVFASDIADATKGKPFTLEHRVVMLPEGVDRFPETLEETQAWEVTG